MAYANSEAVFKATVLEVGVPTAELQKFLDNGLSTMGAFAFSCHFSPGASDEAPFVSMIEGVVGSRPSLQAMAAYRRLFA